MRGSHTTLLVFSAIKDPSYARERPILQGSFIPVHDRRNNHCVFLTKEHPSPNWLALLLPGHVYQGAKTGHIYACISKTGFKAFKVSRSHAF